MSDFSRFVAFIASIQDMEMLEDFLMGLTTEKERKELLQRLEVVRRLIDGTPQLKIAQDLGTGIATVTRGSKELSKGRFKVLREMK